MNTNYWTKEILYAYVNKLVSDKFNIDLSLSNYPLDSIDLAYQHCEKLVIRQIDLDTMCAIIHKADNRTSIALNKNRDDSMQNFDCMHELIHYFFHDLPNQPFFCSDSSSVTQNSFQEWQANEGAAQALVPYQLFIPAYVSLSQKYAHDFWSSAGINIELAERFNVSISVIQNRINNLGYEIHQFLHGVPLEKISLLSNAKISKFRLEKYSNPRKTHCASCLSILTEGQTHCHICGRNLIQKENLGDFRTNIGVGYMIYDKIPLDANSKAISCPRCSSEEIHPHYNICKICGTFLINTCAGKFDNDTFGNPYLAQEPCQTLAEGNQRFCYNCGGITTFYQYGLLPPWQNEYNRKNGFSKDDEIAF